MFARYRKVRSDRVKPRAVKARWQLPERRRQGWRTGEWRIWTITNGQVALTPYTIEVSIVENRRADGKVKQEHIGRLGSIEAHFLPEFWTGLDADVVAELRGEDWPHKSMLARQRFWEIALPRLKRLANRLDVKAMQMSIHRRIPWPMEAERNRLMGEHDVDFWQRGLEGSVKMILITHHPQPIPDVEQTV